jgi:flavin-dependent dehydrogenase
VTEFDVIIVGGRPAGSTLAARLGQGGLRVLLLERSTFPSLPGASSPIIFASTMTLLDEIDADERLYARGTPRLPRMVTTTPDFGYEVRLPAVDGRDYAYAIDRARFDEALWQNALRHSTVTGRQNFAVSDLLWDGDRVVGIVGGQPGGAREQFTAKVVIGADGRFSTVARKVNAAVLDEDEECPTSIYYAYWRGVAPHDERGACSAAYFAEEGLGFLLMDSADDTTVVCVEGRTDKLSPGSGQAEAFYADLLQQYPYIRERIRHAERVTEVRGMRRIGNLYRTPGGAGWGLVGDAYHQKDPIDGQGIYDAVFTAKMMAQAILDYTNGRQTWEESLAWYDAAARAETYPMYRETLNRIKTAIYDDPFEQIPTFMAMMLAQELQNSPRLPGWVKQPMTEALMRGAQVRVLPAPVMKNIAKTMARWMVSDGVYQELAGKAVTRQIKPEDLQSTGLMFGILLRGPLRDLSSTLGKIDRQLERIQNS